MHFGSFDSDDLNSLQPAISLPVKKRQAKPASSANRPSLSSSSEVSSSDLYSSNDNVAPIALPPNHNADPVSPSSVPIHDHQPLYSPNPYDPPMKYIPYNTMHPAYMPPHYNPYMPHPIPPHMSHMQPMHMPPPMYGMQQHIGPTHPPLPHPHAHPHPHSHPHPNQHPHPMPHSHPLSASSPSFTPAHLHHTVHASQAQYPVRTQYEYPSQQQQPPQQSQPLSPLAQHPQQAQEQAQPSLSPKDSEPLPPPSHPTQSQPIQQAQPIQPTQQPAQITQQPETTQQPPLSQELQPPQDPQKTQETPQQSNSQPSLSQTQTHPQTQEPTPEHTAKPSSKKKRGKHGSQKQAQPQSQPQTQPQQPQTPSQTQQSAQQSPPQVSSQTQPLSPKPSQPTQQPEHTPEPQQQPHTYHQEENSQKTAHQEVAQNNTHQEDTHKITHQEDSQKTTLQEDSQNNNNQKNATVPSQIEAPAKSSNWAKILFTPKVSPSASTSASSAPQGSLTQQQNAKSNLPSADASGQKPKLNGHPASNGKSSDSGKSPATPLVPMSAKLLQDLSKLSMTLPALQSRGLKNPTNTCFLNVILQSLVHCPPFAHMLSKLGNVELPSSQMPVTDKFVRLYREFQPNARLVASSPAHATQATTNGANHTDHPSADNAQQSNASKNKYSQSAPPLLPELFFDLLLPFSQRTGIPYKDGDKVNQQDAQEFLTYILDLMHEEFLLFHKSKEPAKTADKSEEWEEVGKKNKSSIVLTSDTHPQSVISHMFGGKQRSSVRKQSQGSKPSVTIEPFYCLHLNIDNPRINSLEDALDAYMEPEKLEGYTDDVRGVEVQASKDTSLETLPRILIIHFKRFAYDMSQPRKLDKFISFPQSLAIKKNFLSKKVASDDKRTYSLYSVVEHRGKVAVKGHYTCDINIGNLHAKPTPAPGTPSKTEKSEKTPQPEKSEWLNFDDHNVSRVHPRDVQNRLAYLLFYVQN